jgi:hypothetical protein
VNRFSDDYDGINTRRNPRDTSMTRTEAISHPITIQMMDNNRFHWKIHAISGLP